MLKQRELGYRILIFFILLFTHLWLNNLLLIIYRVQSLAIDAAIKINNLIFDIANCKINSLFVIALALCFWPLLLTKLLDFILHHLKISRLKNRSLSLCLIWFVFIIDFIFMQQGLS